MLSKITMIIQITQTNKQKRTIGYLKNKVFFKYVRESKHLYKALDAWGIDAEIFTDVLKGQAKKIIVIDKETGKTYKTDMSIFIAKGKYLHFKPHRAQVFLSRRYWNLPEKSIKNNTQLQIKLERKQLKLF